MQIEKKMLNLYVVGRLKVFFFVFEKVAIEIGRVNRTIEKGNDWGKM